MCLILRKHFLQSLRSCKHPFKCYGCYILWNHRYGKHTCVLLQTRRHSKAVREEIGHLAGLLCVCVLVNWGVSPPLELSEAKLKQTTEAVICVTDPVTFIKTLKMPSWSFCCFGQQPARALHSKKPQVPFFWNTVLDMGRSEHDAHLQKPWFQRWAFEKYVRLVAWLYKPQGSSASLCWMLKTFGDHILLAS